MQVKSFTGRNTQEVLAQIKEELGPEAVILGNRTFRKDNVRYYEITAGIDQQNMNGPDPLGGSIGRRGGDSQLSGWGEWHKEWLQIKEHLFSLMKPAIQLDRLTPRQRVALEYLQREGVSDIVVLELYKRLLAKPGASVLESLGDMAPVKGWSQENWPERIHMITGPFGSGKTTSALRMALLLRMQKPSIPIAFINVDCVRGNGRLILRHWAELSDFAYFEAANSLAMSKALAAASGAEKIFLDMPGISGPGTLGNMIRELEIGTEDLAVHLTMPPHYETSQFLAFMARYKAEGLPGSLVWTKLDEAASYGSLINVAVSSNRPISAFSHGSGLKDSMTPATETTLWRLIFKRQLPGEMSAETV